MRYYIWGLAQDYAVAGNQALSAVEVKDRPTTTLTLNSDDVKGALESLVKLVTLNPQRQVSCIFYPRVKLGGRKLRRIALRMRRRLSIGAVRLPKAPKGERAQKNAAAHNYYKSMNTNTYATVPK
jgi:hypothetical protein